MRRYVDLTVLQNGGRPNPNLGFVGRVLGPPTIVSVYRFAHVVVIDALVSIYYEYFNILSVWFENSRPTIGFGSISPLKREQF